jgi:predicted transposase
MQCAIRIKLAPAPAQAAALAETSRQFMVVFNAVCAYGWQHMEKNGIELYLKAFIVYKAEERVSC